MVCASGTRRGGGSSGGWRCSVASTTRSRNTPETPTTMLGNRNQATTAVPRPPRTCRVRSSQGWPVLDIQAMMASTPTNSAARVASDSRMPSHSTPRTGASPSIPKARPRSCSIRPVPRRPGATGSVERCQGAAIVAPAATAKGSRTMHLADTGADRHDVLAIGNAIVDILAYAEDALVEELDLARGAMTLIDEERSAFLYRRLGPAREVSGGSCANTIAGVASLGGRGAYIGRVRDDQLGGVFSHDIRAAGVTFRSRPSQDGPSTAT